MFLNRFASFLPKNDLKKALEFLNSGEYKKACKSFEAHLRKKSGVVDGKDQELLRMYIVESYMEYSLELEKAGDYQESSIQLERAIDLQPNYADVHYRLGMLYENLGRRTDSRASIKKALAINPYYFKARLMLAKSYYSDKNQEKTMEHLRESVSAVPNFFRSLLNELILKLETGSDREDIEDLFVRLLEERPSSSQVSKQLANEAIHSGDFERAIAEMKKALSLNPDYPDLHNLLGISYANMDMKDDAIVEFKTALKINPEYLKARMNLALTLYENGDEEESLTHLQMILEADPANELANNLFKELNPEPSKR